MNFKETIAQLIKRQGLEKKEFVEKLDVSRGTFNNWENGKGEPTLSQLVQMCKILDVPINELVPDGQNIAGQAKKVEVKVIELDVWNDLSAAQADLRVNNKMFQVEIDRLWALVNRLTTGNTGEPIQAHKA